MIPPSQNLPNHVPTLFTCQSQLVRVAAESMKMHPLHASLSLLRHEGCWKEDEEAFEQEKELG